MKFENVEKCDVGYVWRMKEYILLMKSTSERNFSDFEGSNKIMIIVARCVISKIIFVCFVNFNEYTYFCNSIL